MNTNEPDLEILLREIERELRDLKTAHRRPLGALNFFHDSVEFPVTLTESYGIYIANVTVTVTIEKPTAIPPIVQTGWDIPEGFYTTYFYGVNTSSDYATWTYEISLNSVEASTATMKVGVVSSQPVKSIEWSIS